MTAEEPEGAYPLSQGTQLRNHINEIDETEQLVVETASHLPKRVCRFRSDAEEVKTGHTKEEKTASTLSNRLSEEGASVTQIADSSADKLRKRIVTETTRKRTTKRNSTKQPNLTVDGLTDTNVVTPDQPSSPVRRTSGRVVKHEIGDGHSAVVKTEIRPDTESDTMISVTKRSLLQTDIRRFASPQRVSGHGECHPAFSCP